VDKQSHPIIRGKLSQTHSNILSTELHKPKLSRHDLAKTKHANLGYIRMLEKHEGLA
jgi:hypothetical protein